MEVERKTSGKALVRNGKMALKSKMLATDRSTWTFGHLLTWHLDRGTRPDITPDEKGVPWQPKAFAVAVGKQSAEGPKHERTVRNWRGDGTSPSPADFAAILLALFGGKPIYADWRAELTERYHATRGETREPPTAAASPSSLPTKPLRCLGREEDLKSVIDALTAERDNIAVLVLGGAGMGKTTLTREAAVAPAVIDRFGHRRWFVKLETAPNAEALEKAIIVALGLDPASARFDTALARLAQAPGLLVLDNLETPWDGEREAVEAVLALLHRVPQLALLASIRGNEPPAGVRWSRQRTVHPLESPHDSEMFRDIATDIKVDDPSLAPLLALLGGVPIAIELVAQQAAPHDTLAAVYAEWLRVGSALAKRRSVAPSKLSSLDVSLELSFQSPRLTDAGRRLFRILGQLPAGIAPEDVKALFGDAAFDGRQGLLSSGLGFERNGRLDLLPPVRDHACRQHPPLDTDAPQWRNYYFALVMDHGSRIGMAEGVGSAQRVAAELPNLDAAVRAAIAEGRPTLAVDAAQRIAVASAVTGLGTDAPLRALAAACHALEETRGEAVVVTAIGYVTFARANFVAAREAFEQALPLHRQTDNSLGQAHCVKRLGDIAFNESDYNAAREAYERALPLYRQVGDFLGEANCIHRLGEIALQQSDLAAARRASEQALPLYRQIGQILGEANCLQLLGHVARKENRNAARGLYEQALSLFISIPAPYSIGFTHLALASVTEGAVCASHHAAAKEAWLSIGRVDLAEKFGASGVAEKSPTAPKSRRKSIKPP